jgi:hypothetical protein
MFADRLKKTCTIERIKYHLWQSPAFDLKYFLTDSLLVSFQDPAIAGNNIINFQENV